MGSRRIPGAWSVVLKSFLLLSLLDFFGTHCIGEQVEDLDPTPLSELVREQATRCKHESCKSSIVLGFANKGYSKFAFNWVLSLRHAEVENFLLVALDKDAHAIFRRHHVPTYFNESMGIADSKSQHHGSKTFRSIMEIRLRYVVELLEQDFDVWLTDVDAVFNADPFPLLHAESAAELAYDTPFLPKGKDSPLMVMAGFFFMRRCSKFPENCALLRETIQYIEDHPEKHDQFAFNAVLSKKEGEGYKYKLLDPLLFCNGALYFSERAPQMLGKKPAVVQNNHITGVLSKRHRFREHLLWYLDPPSYYQNDSARYLLFDNIQDPLLGIVDEMKSLRAAMMMGRMLKRIVILPLFCLYNKVDGVYPGSSDWCTAEEFLELDPLVFPVREHSFLLNPQTPKELVNAAKKEKIKIRLKSSKNADDINDEWTFTAREADGASEDEIRRWFGEDSLFANEKVLSFESLLGRVQGFDAEEENEKFEEDWKGAVREREEIRRHINHTVSQLSRSFTCVVSWGRKFGSEMTPVMERERGFCDDELAVQDEMGSLMEDMMLRIKPDESLYLALDGLKSAHLEAFRVIWPDVTAFELFPWMNQGFRRHQQTLLIHQGVCRAADALLVDKSSQVSMHICSEWKGGGEERECGSLRDGGSREVGIRDEL